MAYDQTNARYEKSDDRPSKTTNSGIDQARNEAWCKNQGAEALGELQPFVIAAVAGGVVLSAAGQPELGLPAIALGVAAEVVGLKAAFEDSHRVCKDDQ